MSRHETICGQQSAANCRLVYVRSYRLVRRLRADMCHNDPSGGEIDRRKPRMPNMSLPLSLSLSLSLSESARGNPIR